MNEGTKKLQRCKESILTLRLGWAFVNFSSHPFNSNAIQVLVEPSSKSMLCGENVND